MTAKPPALIANRLFASAGSGSPLANDNIDVADFNKANEFIVVFQVDEAIGPWNAQYTLRWRNVTDAGSFAAIAATGEMAWGTGTALTNGSAITARWCQATGAVGSSWQNGEQVEGAATSDAINLADEAYTEIAFAVNPASAHDGDQYEFGLYDQTNGAAIGTGAAALTVAAGVVNYDRDTLVGLAAITGIQPIQGIGIFVPTEVDV